MENNIYIKNIIVKKKERKSKSFINNLNNCLYLGHFKEVKMSKNNSIEKQGLF